MGEQKPWLYTVDEAADILRVGRSTLYRSVKDKRVPYRIGLNGQFLFTAADLEQILEDAYRPAVA